MAVRRQTGPSFGGGKNRPAYHQQAGSLRPPTNGSGPRNNGWNAHGHSNVRHQHQNHNQNNRSRNFNPHHDKNFGGQSHVHPQNVNFRQYNPHHRQSRPFQGRQGGSLNGPHHSQNLQNASSEEQLRVPTPRGPKNRRRRNQHFQTRLYNAVVHDIEMVDIVSTSDLDTDIEMPDAPPLEYSQNLIVAEGIAAANALLSQIEYFVRTGTMPVVNGNFNSH